MDTTVLYEAFLTLRTSREFCTGEPEVLKSLVSIYQVQVNRVYLGHWINPDGYDGSMRPCELYELRDFSQENQKCWSHWFILYSPSPCEPCLPLSLDQSWCWIRPRFCVRPCELHTHKNKIANFAQEHQKCWSRWLLWYSPSPSEWTLFTFVTGPILMDTSVL
jgi:hypothetical protein